MTICLAVFVLMILGFASGLAPMPAVAMFGLLSLTITNCISVEQAFSCICNNTTLTLASMFVISSAFTKTSFIPKLADSVKKISNGSFTKVLAGYVFFTFVLAQFIPSTTAVFALVCPLSITMCKQLKINQSQMVYPLALICSVTAFTLTPFGPYAANFIENNGLQNMYGISSYTNTPFTEMIVKIPPTVFTIIWAIYVCPKIVPQSDKTNSKIFDTKFTVAQNSLKKSKEFLTCFIFVFVIISLILNSFSLPTWIIPALGACILVLFKVLTQKEATQNMGINVVLIYAGVSALGLALSKTGAGNLIANIVLTLVGHSHNSYVLGLVFFVSSFILTSLIYNRAVGKILIPIVLSTASSLGCDPRGLIQMCYIASMCSLLTPMSTSLVPMIVDCTGFSQRDLLKSGWLFSVLICLVTVFCGMTIYPCF